MIRTLGFVTKDDVDNEVRAIRKLCQNQHPNVVQVFDYGQLNPDSMIHFIDMELCDISLANYLLGQELSGFASWTTIREQDEIPTHAYNILQQILNGLLYIHCLEEVHRDLSPQNGESPRRFFGLSSVLFRNGCWKIADFGLTSKGTSKRLINTTGARGKQCYRAPELVQEESAYNNKSDMWSFGCIAFELFTGRNPFSNDIEVWQYTTAKRSPKTYFKGLDNLTKYYINGLLDVDPENRPSARALLKRKIYDGCTICPGIGSSPTTKTETYISRYFKKAIAVIENEFEVGCYEQAARVGFGVYRSWRKVPSMSTIYSKLFAPTGMIRPENNFKGLSAYIQLHFGSRRFRV